MIPTASRECRLWGLQRRRLRRLGWVHRSRRAVYADLVAIFNERRPLELPSATFIGYAELLGHYNGAVAGIRHPETPRTGLQELEDLLADRPAPITPTATPPSAGRRPEAHSAKMSAGMGIPHAKVSAPWDDHWRELARRNGIVLDDVALQEVTTDGRR